MILIILTGPIGLGARRLLVRTRLSEARGGKCHGALSAAYECASSPKTRAEISPTIGEPMQGNTEFIARFVTDLQYESIPQEVVDRAKRQILDVLGVALAGSTQQVGKIVANFVQRTGGTPDCTVWGTKLRS